MIYTDKDKKLLRQLDIAKKQKDECDANIKKIVDQLSSQCSLRNYLDKYIEITNETYFDNAFVRVFAVYEYDDTIIITGHIVSNSYIYYGNLILDKSSNYTIKQISSDKFFDGLNIRIQCHINDCNALDRKERSCSNVLIGQHLPEEKF